jgi:hypothetical protein
MGWFLVRLPETHQQLWVLVAEDNLHTNSYPFYSQL